MDRDLNVAINIRDWGMNILGGQGMPGPIDENQSTPVDEIPLLSLSHL